MNDKITAWDEGFKHGTEWATIHERERIVKILQQTKASFTKPNSFSYPKELDRLITLIEGRNEN